MGIVVFLASGCGAADSSDSSGSSPDAEVIVAVPTTTLAPPPVSTPEKVTTTSTSPPPTSAPSTSSTRTPPTTLLGRPTETALGVFGLAGDVTLHHPARTAAVIGFHESSHDGSQQIELDPGATPHITMETRERGTGSRTAADIAVQPETEIFAPVTGTVLRAGTYTLYCDHADDFAVIEPDDHPGWEVKVFHIVDLQVVAGDRVNAGETLLASHARVLPFESQVDEFSATPAWPHVHIEVVDPSIPDRPSGGGC